MVAETEEFIKVIERALKVLAKKTEDQIMNIDRKINDLSLKVVSIEEELKTVNNKLRKLEEKSSATIHRPTKETSLSKIGDDKKTVDKGISESKVPQFDTTDLGDGSDQKDKKELLKALELIDKL